GRARGARPGHLGRRRVVAEREGAHGRVAGDIAAGAVDRGVRVVGAGVGLGRDAGLEAGGGVAAAEGDAQRVVVPAVCVRGAGGAGGYLRPRLVVHEGKGARGALV